MSKYNDNCLSRSELNEISYLIDTLACVTDHISYIGIDHVQVGDANGEIIGKVQYTEGKWHFQPRRHDKPGILGE